MPPRPKIPAHAFLYAIASIPGIGYALYWRKHRSTDEEFEDMLKKNYGTKIENSRLKKENMVELIGGLKSRDPVQESKFQEILQGGKSESKRHFAVDETLYGTAEGVAQRKAAEEEDEKKRKRRKKKRRKKRLLQEKKEREEKLGVFLGGGSGGDVVKKDEEGGGGKKKVKKGKDGVGDKVVSTGVSTNHAAAVVVLGSLALVTSFLLGGKGGKRAQ